MKILFNCPFPFALAHGGVAIQVQQTMAALSGLGLTVEPVRWWDETQTGDVIHYFGRMPADQIRFAHQKKLRVVMAELLTAQGSRSPGQLWRQKQVSRLLTSLAPRSFIAAFNWDSYRLADAQIALTAWEGHLMSHVFGAPPERVHVVPNGVEEVFFNSPKAGRGPWLVCAATLTERKRVLELAEAAVAAQTPVWIIGQAYADSDSYAQRFFALARRQPNLIRYEGPVRDRVQLARIYREARGFVLLSAMESLSLSALEAAACECPLLLSDLPWARSSFGKGAHFCPVTPSRAATARALRAFYDLAPTLPAPPKPATWREIGHHLKAVYERVLSTSR